MPTIQQLVRKGRALQKKGSKAPDLDSSPQRRGVCLRVARNDDLEEAREVLQEAGFIRGKNGSDFEIVALAVWTRALSSSELSRMDAFFLDRLEFPPAPAAAPVQRRALWIGSGRSGRDSIRSRSS